MKKYVLHGAKEKDAIERRIRLLHELYDKADDKGTHLAQMRQKNLNLALIIFAGFFTFGNDLLGTVYGVFVSLALLSVMVVFCMMDRKYHLYSHGWRGTKGEFLGMINTAIGEPEKDIEYKAYYYEHERTAETKSFQPIIFYLLVLAGIVHYVYSVLVVLCPVMHGIWSCLFK